MTNSAKGISVVICTFNGRKRLLPTLQSISNQRFQTSSFELIVVDNASVDDTQEFCERYFSESQVAYAWKVVVESKPGLNHARLRGFREARFESVLFCDDDNQLNPDYLKIGFDLLEHHPAIGALGGCGIASFEISKPAWFDRYSHSFAVGPQAEQDGKLTTFPGELYGAGTFFRKAPLQKYLDKGFHPIMSDRTGNSLASGGDVEWCYLIQLSNYELWYDHRLTFGHSMPDSRMQWSYYLRLKQGITAGTGRLLPYVCLLKNRRMSVLSFIWKWMQQAVKAGLVYFKHTITTQLRQPSQKPERELALVILRERWNSYRANVVRSYRHFVHLKEMI